LKLQAKTPADHIAARQKAATKPPPLNPKPGSRLSGLADTANVGDDVGQGANSAGGL
jgi:hypothetical protein